MSLKRHLTLSIVAALVAVPAQAQAPAAPAAAAQRPGAGASASYRVGPGDLLSITVYRAPDLQSEVRVSSDGTVPFGALGLVRVSDKTASQIAELLQDNLRTRGILVNPSVNVLVTEVRSQTVMVMGAVARPGEVPLDTPGLTIAAILARSGAEFGTGNAIVTAMGNSNAAREQFRLTDLISGTADRPARAGEILVVQAAPTVYVSGEVGRAGAFPLQPGMTVGQALAVGGGITPRGSRGRVRLTRTVEGQPPQVFENIKFDMPVQANDLIFVKQRIF